jgi:hypothetical protein
MSQVETIDVSSDVFNLMAAIQGFINLGTVVKIEKLAVVYITEQVNYGS